MKLARLELSGFKSFADYTEFLFDDGITSIVGPNGCGKSNVVDAVKWVLGEMSAKSLRGDALMDVIFNGSGTRKPMGMAEVSLTFTNEDRKLPLDAETVKVTRRLYRDSTSEYLINNQMSRLKDIRELFLDTGIGVDAYSLIEQGRVSALLESNSVDRREIFEEAAGISRFKQRKKEAQRKLEKTDQNLAQSALVLEEVEKQLRSVKVQAGRARSFQEYSVRLKELRSAYVMQEYDGLHKKVVTLNEQLADVVDELAAARREMEGRRTRQSELQLELESGQEAVRKSERELLAAQNEQVNLTQRGDFAREQVRQLMEQSELLKSRHHEISERLSARQSDVTKHQEAFGAVDHKLREHEAEVAEASFRQEQASKAIAGLNRSVDEHKSKAIDLMRQIARLHNDINGLKINQENLTNQKGRLEQRKSEIDAQIAELKARVAETDGRKTALAAKSAELQQDAAKLLADQKANNQKMAGLSQEMARKREHRSGLKSRQNVLNDLQSKREGVSEAVRGILKSREKGEGFAYVKGIVADLISTDMEHASVIEAALGDLQNAVIVSDSAALLADREHWSKIAGRVTVLATDRMIAWQEAATPRAWSTGFSLPGEGAAQPASTPASEQAKAWTPSAAAAATNAVDFVKTDSEFSLLIRQILGKTFVVETLAEALDLGSASPASFRFVTKAGEVVDATGSVILGDMSKRGGMISRRAEVARLAWELSDVEAEIEKLAAEMSQCDQASRELDSRQQEIRQQIFQADSQRAEANAQWQQASSQLQRAGSEAPLLAGEIESVQRQMAAAAGRQAEAEKAAAEVEQKQKEVEVLVRDLGSQLIVRQHEVSELAEAATKARVAMGQVQEQKSGISRELATARAAVNQIEMEIRRLSGEAEAVTARIADARQAIAESESRLSQLGEKITVAEADVAASTDRVSGVRGEFSTITAGLDAAQQQIEQYSRREHELSLSKNELSVRIETLIEHTMEELQINLHETYTTYQPASMDWEAVAAEINELKGKISRLGNVNIDAIMEQSQLEERQSSLNAQLADIHDAKGQLEELIGKINEDSRQRFAESFTAIRAEFHEMFRRLFGGGKADLILENPDDVLESGIEIMARPPGKEPQSMSLLSGGEKTMTAVALVMSIFKSKPSPFCILDEVDAALDEANTTRFAGIIQDFLSHSQFIVITHNKRTMSVASTLYGVTMQEQGVSKRVAVKFDTKGNAVVHAPGAPRVAATAEQAAA